jgi:hypothetical protein
MTNLLDRSVGRRNLSEQWVRQGDSAAYFDDPFHPSRMGAFGFGELMQPPAVGATSTYISAPWRSSSYTVVVEDHAPPWHGAVADQLNELAELPPDWNGPHTNPPDRRAVEFAIATLDEVMQDDTPAPTVIPANDGSVQLEWHLHDIDLEMLVARSGALEVAYQDMRDPQNSWDITLVRELTPLIRAMAELTERARAAV